MYFDDEHDEIMAQNMETSKKRVMMDDDNDNGNISDDEDEVVDEDEDEVVDEDNRIIGGDSGEDVYPRVDVGELSTVIDIPITDGEEDDTQYTANYQKFNEDVNENYIAKVHPEHITINYSEISALTKIFKTPEGDIRDPLHRTVPFLTKYEKARILGQRASQINAGSKPFIEVADNIIDGYVIAELELRQKKIPFIIQRPLPNGTSEYWKVQDLEQIDF